MEEEPKQPKKTAKDIYSPEAIEMLLMKANFGHFLVNEFDITAHNFVVSIIQEFAHNYINPESTDINSKYAPREQKQKDMTKFVREVAKIVMNL